MGGDHDNIFSTLIIQVCFMVSELKRDAHLPELSPLLLRPSLQGPELPRPVDPFPQPIMKWTEGFYTSVFQQHGEFGLRENGTRGSLGGCY